MTRSERRLEAALTICDLRDIARRRTPRAAFDYTVALGAKFTLIGRA